MVNPISLSVLILMRVGSESAKRWVVREMTVACDYEDVVLARMVMVLLIFPYSHNILDVIAAAMDPKAKAPTPMYGVVNMTNRSRKRKAPVVEPLDFG